MKKYLLIVRCQILMGRPVTDDELKSLGLYHEIPFQYNVCDCEAVEIVDEVYDLLCAGKPEFRYTESAELVCVA